MPKYCVRVVRNETYADITVEAESEDEAQASVMDTQVLSAANWQVSEGNVVKPDDCYAESVEKIG